jgi:hypothetical protein
MKIPTITWWDRLRLLIIAILILPAIATAAQFEAGLEIIKQTTEERSYSVAFANEWAHTHLGADYSYAESDGEAYIDQGTLILGYDYPLSRKWSLWADESLGYDKPAGIILENFVGAGPKYTIYSTDSVKASLSFGYLQHDQDYGDGERYTTKRWSWRGKFKWVGDKAEAAVMGMHQPAIGDPEDYINAGEAHYSVALNDAVSLKMAIESEYRSVEDARKLIQTMNLVYRLGE